MIAKVQTQVKCNADYEKSDWTATTSKDFPHKGTFDGQRLVPLFFEFAKRGAKKSEEKRLCEHQGTRSASRAHVAFHFAFRFKYY